MLGCQLILRMHVPTSLLRVTLFRCSVPLCSSNRTLMVAASNLNVVRLAEVGRFDEPKLAGKYDTGQLFLHRVFGYRGVILFPWIAKVYDRDTPNKPQNPALWFPHSSGDEATAADGSRSSPISTDASGMGEQSSPSDSPGDSSASSALPSDDSTPSSLPPTDSYIGQMTKENIKGSAHTYYQVLIDSRDCQFLKLTKKAQTEAVTFLGNQDNGRTLYAVPGLDYVAHEDILPFTAADQRPIHHELFHKFLTRVPAKGETQGLNQSREPVLDPPYIASETLTAWQRRNHPWLELSDVHKETTEGVRVTVIPFYMGCREAHSPQSNDVYWWRYCIRLENLGESSVQLRERHWRIFSLSGTLETVRGRGVVGSEPVLTRRDPAFQYSSHVSLQSPSGHMWGTFRMEREDGYVFECRIPPFSLESKQGEGAAPPTPATE